MFGFPGTGICGWTFLRSGGGLDIHILDLQNSLSHEATYPFDPLENDINHLEGFDDYGGLLTSW